MKRREIGPSVILIDSEFKSGIRNGRAWRVSLSNIPIRVIVSNRGGQTRT